MKFRPVLWRTFDPDGGVHHYCRKPENVAAEVAWATEDGRATIHHGDCLDVMRSMPDGSVDAVVTDPPYASVSESASLVRMEAFGKTAARRTRAPSDTQFFEAWIREHLNEWARVLKPTGAVWLTLDWRGAMALDTAAARLGLKAPAVGVWDRGGLGMGSILRHVYECFVVLPMEGFERRLTDEPDVWRFDWSPGNRETGHSAEKPVGLYRRALRLVAHAGALILDPFAGSGTTGVAAIQEGCRFVGIEREAQYVEIAKARIANEAKQGSLFGGAS